MLCYVWYKRLLLWLGVVVVKIAFDIYGYYRKDDMTKKKSDSKIYFIRTAL